MSFLSVTPEELKERGADAPDFVLVTGDAYVDHPSFGAAIIGRYLESLGYVVGIIAQPDIANENSFSVFGEPKLAFLVTSGNIDSMVAHYSVAKKKREKDSYSLGGRMGLRPDRACVVYSQKIRKRYKHIPIILGGLEASLRRLTHYDYLSDKLRKPILIESGADLVVYGMGERAIREIADHLKAGVGVKDIKHIRGTVYKAEEDGGYFDTIKLPSYEELKTEEKEKSTQKPLFAGSFRIQYECSDAIGNANALVESCGGVKVVCNPAALPLSTDEMDEVYKIHFERKPHPMYTENIPAIEEVKFSLTSVRGCFGACSFCALSMHQGRFIQARSHESIINEAELLTKDKDFKGYIHDVGGPTANFRQPSCAKAEKLGMCKDKRCLFPKPCKNLRINHSDYVSLLRKLRAVKGVKKVFIRSGVRFDYAIHDPDDTFIRELTEHHVSGQLKVAPEHVAPVVLEKMGKPQREIYDRFKAKFDACNKAYCKEQYIVPYLMSSHPGSTLKEAVALAEYLRDNRINSQQVQDFYPTPGSASTAMYYTGLDPFTMKAVYSAKLPREKAMQRALIQYRLPQNYELVKEALELTGRTDLIGFGDKALIKPRGGQKPKEVSAKPIKKKTIRNIHKKKK